MQQPAQIGSAETPASANEFPVSAPAASGGLLPAQQGTFAESITLDFTGKEAGCAGMNETRNISDQNAGEENEYLLKLVASLESCNMALLNKLNQAERELAALRQSLAQILPEAESTDNPEQSHGWERKLTRAQWRPT